MYLLVVYFSVTGNTKNIAKKIATVTEADIYEIKPAENAGSGKWIEGKRFDAKVSEEEIKGWIGELQ